MRDKSIKSKSRHEGFSLVEVMIALGCITVLGLGISSLSQMAIQGSIRGEATLASIEQRSELRDLLLKAPKGTSASSCISRLGLNGTEVFTPGSHFVFQNLQYQNNNKNLNLGTVYLANDSFVGTDGVNNVYSAQLILSSQSTQVAGTINPLRDSILGLMNITIDSQGHIIACNWDQVTSNALTICSQTPGMMVSGSACVPVPSLPAYGVCPTSMALDPTAGTCVPANVQCGSSYASTNFDGSTFSCSSVPVTYTIAYPQNYHSTPTNGGSGSPTNPGGSTPSQGSNSGTVASPTCTCGNSTMTAGGSQLCVQASTVCDGIFGSCTAHDDMFDVQICNSQGVLQTANPAHYFEEQGNGVRWSWRIASCANYGGTKSKNGIWYSTGNCW